MATEEQRHHEDPERLERLEHRVTQLERTLMAQQSDIDALTAQVTQIGTDLATAQADLQTEINNLAAANPALDLSALTAAIAPIDAAVTALDTLAPTPPAA